MSRSGWTSHGWWYGPDPEPTEGRPALRAKCGGPAMCMTCHGNAGESAPPLRGGIDPQLPLIEDAPITTVKFLIGTGGSSDGLHAVKERHHTSPRSHVPSVCGPFVTIAKKWGEFIRGNEYVDRRDLCPECAWLVALEHGTADAELAVRRPKGAAWRALQRALPDPLMFVRLCDRLLELGRENDADHDELARLLGHVTAHQPVVLLAEGCTEGDCDCGNDDACYGDEPTVVCMACSVLAGSWAGEWEGQVHIAVPPCGVLPAVAAHYGVSAVAS